MRRLIVALLLTAVAGAHAAEVDQEFASVVNALNTRDYGEKLEVARSLAQSSNPRADVILSALLEGKLYRKRRSNEIVIAESLDGGGYLLTDAITDENLGEVGRRGARKISVNNSLRRQLRGLIAGRQLSDPDAIVRARAVDSIVESQDTELMQLVRQHRANEADASVLAAIDAGLVIADLDVAETEVRLAAITAASKHLHPLVRSKLAGIVADDAIQGDIREAALQAVRG